MLTYTVLNAQLNGIENVRPSLTRPTVKPTNTDYLYQHRITRVMIYTQCSQPMICLTAKTVGQNFNDMNQIDPYTLLPVETGIMVKDTKGYVVKGCFVSDTQGGPICLHTVKLTHKMVRKGQGQCMLFDWKELPKPVVKKVNYSFIRTLNPV